MCGIFLSVSKHGLIHPSPELKTRFINRGPDSCRHLEALIQTQNHIPRSVEEPAAFHICLYAAVLSVRSEQVVCQPIQVDEDPASSQVNRHRNALCWNGEAYGFGTNPVEGSDAKQVFTILDNAAFVDAEKKASGSVNSAVLQSIISITGPFAFVFLDAYNNRIYFGRDVLGRRSLVYKIEDGTILLSSVSDGSPGWSELEADGIYFLNPFSVDSSKGQVKQLAEYSPSSTVFNVGCLPYNHFGKTFALNRDIRHANLEALSINALPVIRIEEQLRSSLALRLLTLIRLTEESDANTRTPRLAILFSGGLDCTVLARLTDEYLPRGEPIDLLNVAFENPRIHSSKASTSYEANSAASNFSAYETCPDRITARSSHEELQKTCPDREWKLVLINVPYSESSQHRQTVRSLISPHNTEMDMSIALALYFAARGSGYVSTPSEPQPTSYTTPARVLLSGLGADELFGGYQRHALAFARQGHEGLLNELALDISRLGKRNLGRDDRVTSHWSREVRYPYLDEDLVQWAVRASVHEKCGFGSAAHVGTQEEGLEPGKLVLRLLAKKLGLGGVAKEKKRAIQFGSRTAKMESGRSKGTDALS